MPSLRNRLTDAKTRTIKKNGWYPDGAGLYIQVTSPTAKSWVYRYTKKGTEHRLGLGPYPTIELKAARGIADECRRLRAEGEDPKAHLKGRRFEGEAYARERSFEECAEAYMVTQRPSWSNAKHAQQWTNTLTSYAYPYIGKLNIDSITTNDVVACLEPIWAIKTETASRVRQRIESIFDWARAKGYRNSENPAVWKGLIQSILPAPKRLTARKHHPYMEQDQLPAFYSWLASKNTVSAQSLRFVILTAARHGEGRGTLYSEVDEKNRLWTLPPERMKTGKWHKVPLSSEAMRVIDDTKTYMTGDFAFSSTGVKGISETALRNLLGKYIAESKTKHCVVHGFRSSFRVWAASESDLGYAIKEMALSHNTGNSVASAYLNNDFIEDRRVLMEDWARFLVSGENS